MTTNPERTNARSVPPLQKIQAAQDGRSVPSLEKGAKVPQLQPRAQGSNAKPATTSGGNTGKTTK